MYINDDRVNHQQEVELTHEVLVVYILPDLYNMACRLLAFTSKYDNTLRAVLTTKELVKVFMSAQ